MPRHSFQRLHSQDRCLQSAYCQQRGGIKSEATSLHWGSFVSEILVDFKNWPFGLFVFCSHSYVLNSPIKTEPVTLGLTTLTPMKAEPQACAHLLSLFTWHLSWYLQVCWVNSRSSTYQAFVFSVSWWLLLKGILQSWQPQGLASATMLVIDRLRPVKINGIPIPPNYSTC